MLKSKFSLDYTQLDNSLNKKSFKLTPAQVKSQLEVVGFDIVRFRDDDKSSKLWDLEATDDGNYIVSLYEDDTETTKTALAWEVVLSKTANTFNFFYKGAPITKMSASQLGLPAAELNLVERYLPARLASNPQLVQALLDQLSEPAKKEVYSKYPELAPRTP